MTTIWTSQAGNVAVTPVIDCGDRFVFKIGVSKSQESWALLQPVEQALMAAFGATADLHAGLELRTVHGPQYTGGAQRPVQGLEPVDLVGESQP